VTECGPPRIAELVVGFGVALTVTGPLPRGGSPLEVVTGRGGPSEGAAGIWSWLADTDIEVALGLVYGRLYHRSTTDLPPLCHRPLHGHAPLNDRFVSAVVDRR
jgi:hypothetical protein